SGVATTPGTYAFTLRITSNGVSLDRVCTIKITGLTIKDGNGFGYLPSGAVGVPYSYALTAVNAAGATTWSAQGLPPGFSIDAGGVITGTPTFVSSWQSSLTVSDGVDSVTRRLWVVVDGLAVTGTMPNAVRGAPYN